MANNFAKLLKKHKTTTYRVSQETGVPNTTLYEWSKGMYTPKVETLAKVAKHFGVTIEDLI